MRAWFRIVLLLSLVLGLVGCDQVSKSAAKAHLEDAAGYPLVGNALELRYTENRDIGFNALRAIPEASRGALIRVAGAAALLALGAMLARSRKDLALASALALIFAGAVGNYADRIWRGYVVDFVHLAHWPVFNLADVYITSARSLWLFTPTAAGAAWSAPDGQWLKNRSEERDGSLARARRRTRASR